MKTAFPSFFPVYRDIEITLFLISVKLTGDFNASMGGVLVYNNKWHAVCDSDFDSRDARVVCRTLGFSDGKVIHGSAFGNLTYDIGEDSDIFSN